MGMEKASVERLFKHKVDLSPEEMGHALLHIAEALMADGAEPMSFAVTSDGPTGCRIWLSTGSMRKLLMALNKEKIG